MKNKKITSSFYSTSKIPNTVTFCNDKIILFKRMITQTILAMQKYKNIDVISASDLNIGVQQLENIHTKLQEIINSLKQKNIDYDTIIGELQNINNEMSALFRNYGTQNMDDLITVAMGADYYRNITKNDKYKAISNYAHPIGYKVLPWKKDKQPNKKILAKNRIVEDYMIVETSANLDCFDLARTSRNFHKRVYGIKIAIQNFEEKKTLILFGLVDDLLLECVNEKYFEKRLANIYKHKPTDPDFQTIDFERFVQSITAKELLIYSNKELYKRFVGYLNQINLVKTKPISQNVKEFINADLYEQRKMLIQLLIKSDNPEYKYLAYLLYDLLSNDTNGNIDTLEQTILFDSFPWNIKKFFREAMKTTLDYTKTLSNFDQSKIPLEQQICLMKAPDNVKEKAMLKLKEIKAKSEDSGSKARQYLNGLLKIPFNIYCKEDILFIMETIIKNFNKLIQILQTFNIKHDIPNKSSYSTLEIFKYLDIIDTKLLTLVKEQNTKLLTNYLIKNKRNVLIANTCSINNIIKKNKLTYPHLCHSGKKNKYLQTHLAKFVYDHSDNLKIMSTLQTTFPNIFNMNDFKFMQEKSTYIKTKNNEIFSALQNMQTYLDTAVYGHTHAKRQLERIIGQWISGKSEGYCFGFEGPPGVGKTSLAKNGLAKCLKNSNGECRPFSFIALGGSSNGSTLCGHNYTYVGSTWGRIVDILIDKKCMNPIIFIDELDKVSNSERGKEIIGVLTHLIDSTQNNAFQDNYFSGIDLDLSKALFIFSYNDPSLIDNILLDRIHRIKFKSLTIKEKLIIVRDYLLPTIYENIGLKDSIEISDDVVRFIIESYTNEAGVRKLKAILFEIVSEINLEILHNDIHFDSIPLVVTKELITNKYLHERRPIIYTTIHDVPTIGLINGLWANSLGKGGSLPIECSYFIAPQPLDFKLTGMQGDVMQESMNVAKTLAWKLTPKPIQNALLKEFKKNKMQGIHIHCPAGATPKDGPSAGTAITITIYSLLNNKKIKNNIAITGEINLQGKVTAIGGLPLKIMGGIRAGVTEFIFPTQNKIDYDMFLEKHPNDPCLEGITFHALDHIRDVLDLVFI